MSGQRLIEALPRASGALSFVHDGEGLVGWGQLAATTVTGTDAAAQIARWYTEQLARLDVVDDVAVTGTGPVCFVSLGFSPSDISVAVIPRVVVGRRDGLEFVTTIGDDAASPVEPVRPPGQVRYHDAALSTASFTAAVAAAVARIRAGEAQKVVLAHGLQAETDEPVDERYLLARLEDKYPSCVAYAVDGLVGASPELLIRRLGRTIFSRVLAGTAWPEHVHGDHYDSADAAEVATHLLASAKDMHEHRFAVQSVADALTAVTAQLTVPRRPSALALANLTHLATDVTGELTDADTAPSALELAALLHPTAAVGGTPTAIAQAIIDDLEPDPRGRYAAPIGWIDANGDGEFAIALRCAQVTGTSVRLMAGCGIVAESDPETEAQEAQIKMIPVRDALEG